MNAPARESEARPIDDLGPAGRFSSAWKRDEPLARHTSMRVGGPADLFCEVASDEELGAWIAWGRERAMPVFLLGGGTNLIVGDRGIRGLVLKLGRRFVRTEWTIEGDDARVVVGAAANFKRVVLDTLERGFTGLEFGEGIPGTIGGGVIMNAGAFGGEIGEVVEAICGVDANGNPSRLPREALHFSYRHLALPAGFVVTALEVHLRRGDREEIQARAAEARRRRGLRQPLGQPNAGSIWKNPPGDFAGRLIEQVGLQGEQVGGAQISPRHANFIVNTGSATAADIRALMDLTRDRVWAARGVWLEPEVRLVGEW
ncbi:MAG: UDP-N-acetylmuramate dehydrogenase [Deltaproteobacteria bacterium]|nr:UDP-N-acetylmuramate dehydrogenase [Deltaproteobacteria bacterium]